MARCIWKKILFYPLRKLKVHSSTRKKGEVNDEGGWQNLNRSIGCGLLTPQTLRTKFPFVLKALEQPGSVHLKVSLNPFMKIKSFYV
jgi:hypothetical protein